MPKSSDPRTVLTDSLEERAAKFARQERIDRFEEMRYNQPPRDEPNQYDPRVTNAQYYDFLRENSRADREGVARDTWMPSRETEAAYSQISPIVDRFWVDGKGPLSQTHRFKQFLEANPQSVQSAMRLGEQGISQLIERFLGNR